MQLCCKIAKTLCKGNTTPNAVPPKKKKKNKKAIKLRSWPKPVAALQIASFRPFAVILTKKREAGQQNGRTSQSSPCPSIWKVKRTNRNQKC